MGYFMEKGKYKDKFKMYKTQFNIGNQKSTYKFKIYINCRF